VADPVIWQLAPEHSEQAGAVLARGFLDEPVVKAAYGDPERWSGYLRSRLTASVRYACRFGEVWAVGPVRGEIAGAAVWVREPRPERTDALSAELGYPDDPEGEAAMGRINAMLAKAEEEFGAMTPVWRSLDMIAIAPERQGQGLGSALLRRLLDDAASAGETLALVTDRPINVPFYEKAGMELVWSGASDDGVVPLWSFRKG